MLDNAFQKIDTARTLLGLPEHATIDEIKKAYRTQMKKYHPDKNREDNEAHWKTLELIDAYETIVKYCQQYIFSFRKEDVLKIKAIPLQETTDAEFAQWWQKHYGDDPLWGKGGIDE